MNTIETRLSENYPTIQMTVVSLVVALVFENLIQVLKEQPAAWRMTSESFLMWSQCVVTVNLAAMYWVKLTVDSSTLRVPFSPLDGLNALAAGVGFMVLASSIGEAAPAVWTSAAAGLLFLACGIWTYHDRCYQRDPEAFPAAGSHNSGIRAMALGGTILAATAILSALQWVDEVATGLALLLGVLLLDVAHWLWYRNWKRTLSVGQGTPWIRRPVG